MPSSIPSRFRTRPVGLGPVAVEIDSDDPSVPARFDHLLEAFEAPAPGAAVLAITIDTCPRQRTGDPPLYDSRFEGELLLGSAELARQEARVTRLLNARRVDAEGDLLHVHSAAVASDDRAVMLVGRAGAGKSTLAAALVRQGWEYLTDEQSILRPADARLLPYPRPVTLRRSSWPLFAGVPGIPAVPDSEEGAGGESGVDPSEDAAVEIAPHDLGPVYRGHGAEVTTVIAPGWRADPGEVLQPMATRAEIVELLSSCCYDLERMGRPGLETLIRVAADCGGGWRLDFNDPVAAARLVCETFERDRAAPGVAARRIAALPYAPLPPGTVRRRAGADAWAFQDGSTVVYHPPSRTMARLDAAGTALWEKLAAPQRVDDLAQEAGHSEDAGLEGWLETLISFRLLETDDEGPPPP